MARRKAPKAFDDILTTLAQTLQEEDRLNRENRLYWEQLQRSRKRLAFYLQRIGQRILRGVATPHEEALYERCLVLQGRQALYQEVLERLQETTSQDSSETV